MEIKRRYIALTVIAVGLCVWAHSAWQNANELIFRSSLVWQDGKAKTASRVAEWRLQVPDGFYIFKEGYYPTVYEHGRVQRSVWTWWRRFPDGGSLATIGSALNPADEIVPNDRLSANYKTLRQFSITMGNNAGIGERFPVDYCITSDERFRSPDKPFAGCADTAGCSIYMSYQGWPLTIGVPREGLYREPERVCRILRATLAAWTKHIDDLRSQQSDVK